MRVASPAKVNLCLRVIGKRGDGYHALQSLVAFADVADSLSVTFADADFCRFSHSGGVPDGAGNYCVKALELFVKYANVPVKVEIFLGKDLPLGAGLGGGTMNGAMTLRLLNKLYDYPLDEPTLLGVAAHLGADGVVCAYGRTAWVEGTGTKVAPLPPLPAGWLVLAWPGQGLVTKDVFTHAPIAPLPVVTPPADGWPTLTALADWLAENGGNSLTPNACALLPVVADVKTALAAQPDCLYADMTGSGAACFGLFADEGTAAKAAATLQAANPAWWVRAGRLLNTVYEAA